MKPFFIALQFLTRLKLVKQEIWTNEDFGRSVVTFPLVGLVIGLFMTAFFMVLQAMGIFSASLIMLLLVIFEFLFTGGLHADGFMDTCDGIFSGRDRERMLAIMKDSRIGSNGVVGFIFLVLLKWNLLVTIPAHDLLWVLVWMPFLSRYTMMFSITSFPYARPEGMGKAFAVYSPDHTKLYGTVFVILMNIAVYLISGAVYAVMFAALWVLAVLTNVIFNRYLTKILGGVTGDTYGFVTEMTELLLLVYFIVIEYAMYYVWMYYFLR